MINRIFDIATDGARRFGDSVAFRWKDTTLSFNDVDDRTGRLAAVLRNCGVQDGDRVGVFMRKGIETPVALYGTMRAGCAYVPLDVTAPSERIAWLLRDCGINVLLTTQDDHRAVKQLVNQIDTSLVVIGCDIEADNVRSISWADVYQSPGSYTGSSIRPTDMAYVMYTSGSTGLPKGIVHTHSSGLAYASTAADLYGLGPDDRLSNHSPIYFDMSTFDYFSGPMRGASTTIIPAGVARMPASMSSLIERDQITIWYSVPLALTQLVQHGVLHERDCSSIRWVLFGGEPFPVKHLRDIMAAWPHARFANVYGPAEVNQCTHYEVPDRWVGDPDCVPLGSMWSAARGIVVDEADNLIDGNDVGELLVETPTMMRGYWNRQDLTERAITEVVKDGAATLHYRTGDLVYRNDAGDMVFVGRKDHQIKTRGYRVELNEIEALLVAIEGVEEAAAFPIENEVGSTLIEAAVISVVGGPSTTDLLQHLRSALPTYALPVAIHERTHFPRTQTGKIDRVALRDIYETKIVHD